MKKKLARGLALPLAFSGLAIAGMFTLTTTALFSDSQTTAASFTAGTVDLAASPASAVLTGTNLAPGDVMVGEIVVNNTGTLEYRYALRGSVTNNVGWEFTVKAGVTTCDEAGFTQSGTVLYGPGPLQASPTNVVGDDTPGQQMGDRLVSAGVSEKICVEAQLPFSTGNEVQGQTEIATFTFNAEQTANN